MIDDDCDGLDNDCNGNVDDAWDGDIYEPNESSSGAYSLGYLSSNSSVTVYGYVFDGSDVDVYKVRVSDTWSSDFGLDVYLNSVPANADLDLEITKGSSSWSSTSGLDGDSESINIGEISWSDQSGWYTITVYPYSSSDISCSDSYQLSIYSYN